MSTRTEQGMSLLELMIVVAILLTLAGIVFAAFGPARDRARRTVCISNLRQIGLALTAYRHDYNGDDPRGVPTTQASLGLPDSKCTLAWVDTYLRDRRILFCPSFHEHVQIQELGSTYAFYFLDDCEGAPLQWCFRYVVANRGLETPTVLCSSHNGGLTRHELMIQPRWKTMSVNVLRLSGQVQSKQVPVRSTEFDW